MSGSRRVLGEEHPETLTSISNVGRVCRSQGRLVEAESFYREALDKRRRVLGDSHPDTLTSCSNLGSVLQAEGKLREAEDLVREAVDKSEVALGKEHPDTLTSINNLGSLLQAQGRLAEAKACFLDSLEKRRRVLGDEDADTLSSINNLGFLHQVEGNLADAESCFREAVEKSGRVQDGGHSLRLTFIANLSRVLYQRSKYQEAIDLLLPFETARSKAVGGGNVRRLADLLNTLGRARIGLGYDAERFALAEENLLEAHPIYFAAKDRGPTHKDTRECVQALVDLYTAWHAAEPGKGYDAKAAEWKAKLEVPKLDAAHKK
jgi:tetratricopeptide (TPR) repeat protein